MTPFEKATESELDEMITLMDSFWYPLSTIEAVLAWVLGERSQDVGAPALLAALKITGPGGL